VKILEMFKPKWRQGSTTQRKETISRMNDTQELKNIIKQENASEVLDSAITQLLECAIDAQMSIDALGLLPSQFERLNVIRTLKSQQVLEYIAMNYPDDELRVAALRRLTSNLDRYRAIKTIKSEYYLKSIVIEEPCGYLKAAALQGITSQKYLSEIMLQIIRGEIVCPLPPVVLQRFFTLIDDQSIYGLFVTFYHNRPRYAKSAMDKIQDTSVLLSIIQNRLVSSDTRKIAIHKIGGNIPLWSIESESVTHGLKMPAFSLN
jgi:hypothetical protein